MTTIRPAGRLDLPGLFSIDPLAKSDAERRQSLAHWAAAGHCHVALRDERLVGYVALTRGFFHRPFVELLLVAEDARRTGIGLELLTHCIEASQAAGRLWCSTNASNLAMQGLLGKAGFTRSGSIENLDEGDPELVYLFRHPTPPAD